jgi:hypothetical protein
MQMIDDERTPLIPLDSGWLFLLPGLVVLCATILIPALDDVDDAKFKRDRVLAIEQHRLDRLQNYIDYLDAVDRGDESVVLSLVATQLNMMPEEAIPISPPTDPARTSASVYPELEPPPLLVRDAPPKHERSLLTRLAIGEKSRLWMIVVGAVCVLIGLLPAAGDSREAATPTRRDPAPA